ncbi:MAG: beta-eliminating lyase-related protein [Pseudomonadota bacterium]
MNFASDNTGPAHPRVMEAVVAANDGSAMPYGKDPWADRAVQAVRDVFNAPEAAVYLVPTGTAANAALLATLTPVWGTIFCHEDAHIAVDECNAPEFYTGGAKLTPVAGAHGKMTPGSLATAIARAVPGDVHSAQRGPISVTNVTEAGTVYSLDELAALTTGHGLPAHLDGARFANACAALDCSAADMAQGFDAISFGGTKNGCLGVEAAVILDPARAWEFELRRKRAGHLFSKHRYLSAQMAAYLKDDLWLTMARAANAACARLAAGLRAHPDVVFRHDPQANMIFAAWPRALHQALKSAGAEYYVMDGDWQTGPADEILTCRLVCDWSKSEAEVDRFLAIIRAG